MKSLKGLRVLSLGLNLPAPVAAQRARQLGARVRKIEPVSGDPLAQWAPAVYAELHAGVRVQTLDLRTPDGQRRVQRELANSDVLLTAFRPAALARLGLDWGSLHRQHPQLWQVAIVGSVEAPQDAGHDLSYQTLAGLLPAQGLPTNLWADMAGAQAALLALHQVRPGAPGRRLVIGLQDALLELARPQQWGLTSPGALLGGGHALYQRYRCRDGDVVLAALEPKFAQAMAMLAGLPIDSNWLDPINGAALQSWLASCTCTELEGLAAEHDLPLVVCPEA
jgi:crotonobetainyl-CoA:carnitine CoA-transferase CaiB-like acyl-CoA transferase